MILLQIASMRVFCDRVLEHVVNRVKKVCGYLMRDLIDNENAAVVDFKAFCVKFVEF